MFSFITKRIVAMKRYSQEEEIADFQFLDKGGQYHMTEYLAYYERQDSLLSSAQETSMADSLMTSFFTPVTYESQQSWEKVHRPEAYYGGLKEYIVTPGIRRIGKQAFGYNLNLEKIMLPDGLEEIDREAFIACERLKSVTIPESVKVIGKDAFDHGTKEIVFLGHIPPEISTLGISTDCEIIVPEGLREDYCKVRQWKKYSRQIIET